MTSGDAPTAIIVGSGLAGLTCALELAGAGWRTIVVTAGRAGRDGATHRVHALTPWILLTAPWVKGDSPQRLLVDLERRGEGMRRPGLAEAFAENAHAAARELIELLDLAPVADEPAKLPGDELPRGMRCLPRNRHLLLAPLLRRCAALEVEVLERTLLSGLCLDGERVAGVTLCPRGGGAPRRLLADAVVLACGGSGAVFPVTTTPRWCRGSGLAAAAWAGALLHHPGLTQALPVTATPPLYFPTSAALVAGRVRVAGDLLPAERDLEVTTLAVARAQREGAGAFLEVEETGPESSALPRLLRSRPSLATGGRVALTVAQHHGIGGVAIDAWGRTSVAGLYACGEAAGGVQGRRRTMGTGLLEAAIFARRAARAASGDRRKGREEACELREASAPLPLEPERLERRLDELLGPLVVERPPDAVAAAVRELEAWPVRDPAVRAADERAVLAAIRQQAALLILRGSAASEEG